MADELVYTSTLDSRAAPLIEALTAEYDARYGTYFNAEGAKAEMNRYPPEAFAPPHGNFLLLLRDGETIGGGAFMRYSEDTAEFKRIWTHSVLRRQGLAKKVLDELELQAHKQGYRRVYLTTGFRQPEAKALYLNYGYSALFDVNVDPQVYGTLPFEKDISTLFNAEILSLKTAIHENIHA